MRPQARSRILSKLDKKLNNISEMWIPNLPGNKPIQSSPTPEVAATPSPAQTNDDEFYDDPVSSSQVSGDDEFYDDSEEENTDWKDPHSPDYDRQVAENALYYTIGPLTDSPRWAPGWTEKSRSGPPPDYYIPGGPAPRWTKEEVTIAFCGDPAYTRGPKSPKWGNMGGSPMLRAAKEAARTFDRVSDDTIMNCFQLGSAALSLLMEPGNDESRSAFIPWVITQVKYAMRNGVGGTTASRRALSAETSFTSKGKDTYGDTLVSSRGLGALLKVKTGDDARSVGEQVKGKYRLAKANDKHDDNYFGPYSKDIYDIAMALGDAMDAVAAGTGDESDVLEIKQQIQQMIERIKEENVTIPGIGTGAESAISNKDRKTKMDIVSADAPSGMDETGTLGDMIAAKESDGKRPISKDSVKGILQKALTHDFSKTLGRTSRFTKGLPSIGDVQKGTSPSNLEVTGRMTMAEMRFIIRHLGEAAADYPGRGIPRKNTHIPRDTQGQPWVVAGEDPEIEPIPNGGVWESAWIRNGCPHMTPSEIAAEMTNEVDEFIKLGIPTSRRIANKAGGKRESMSPTSVSTLAKKAFAKLMVAGRIYGKEYDERDQEATEQFESILKSDGILVEDLDSIDLQIIRETTNYIASVYKKYYEPHKPRTIVIPRPISTILKDHQNRKINKIIDSV